MEVVLIRAMTRSIPIGVAALMIGFAVKSGGRPAGPVEANLENERAGLSVLGKSHPEIFGRRPSVRSQVPAPAVRLASLETKLTSAAEEADASFEERFGASFEERFGSSFNERFGASNDERLGSSNRERPREEDETVVFGGPVWPLPFADALQPALRTFASRAELHANGVLPSGLAKRETAAPAISQPAPALATVTAPSLPLPEKKPVRAAEAPSDSILPPDADSHTAIYDIAAHVVYLPNGERLEAHSGLGRNLDDPHSIDVRGRGPTPPNVYDLVLRKQPFHGVRAIRLIPVGEGKMFGRDGMLAHSYMLGPNGQSNGCVSFSNYPAFLNAYLKGDVDRLVVVQHLASAPAPRASSGWLSETLRNLFNPS
jgi:hypothetical protein